MDLAAFLAQVAIVGGGTYPAITFDPVTANAPPPIAMSMATGECAPGMKHVFGTHYSQVERLCLDFHHNQCWNFYAGAVAFESVVTPIDVCMDEYEWPNQKGAVPHVMMKFTEARSSCESVGKRLCTEFEWEMACEGPRALPFPYGNRHEPKACHNYEPYRAVHHSRLSSSDATVRDNETKRLWQGKPSGSHPDCVSELGVADLVGSVEEWVSTSRPIWPYESSLKGGYWSKSWSGCRGTNDSHGPSFRFYEIGFRCCAPTTGGSR